MILERKPLFNLKSTFFYLFVTALRVN